MTAGLLVRLFAAICLLEVALWGLGRLLGRRFEWRAVALALLLASACLWPWLAGPELLAPSDILLGQIPGTHRVGKVSAHATELNDAVFQFIPWELEVRHALRAGRLPLWSDLLDGGSSPWVNLQTGVLSPHAILARALPIQHHLLAALFLKILTAFQGAWLLGRCLGLRAPGRIVLALGYGFGGPIAGWALFAHSAVAAWIPWLTASLVTLLRPAGPAGERGGFTAAALTTTALLLSGQPEVAASGVLVASLTAITVRRRRARLGAVALAGLLGAGVAAAQLVPFTAALPHSIRAQEHSGSSGDDRGAGAVKVGFDPARMRMLLGPVAPHVFGIPFRTEFRGPMAWSIAQWSYVGVAAFLGLVGCAGLGRGLRRYRALRVVLGLLALTLLLLAAGFRPLERLVLTAPLLRLPEYARFLPGAALALAILGALGLQAIWRAPTARRVLACVVAATVSVGLSATLWTASLWALLATAVCAPPRHARLRVSVLAVAAALDLVAWCRLFQPRATADSFFPATPTIEAIRGATAGGPWRVTAADYLAYPATLAVYGLADIRHHNPLADGDHASVLDVFGFRPSTAEYFTPMRHLDHPLLDFLNVRVVISNRYLPPLDHLARLPAEENELWILYRNDAVLPRWFVPDRLEVAPRRDILSRLQTLRDARTVWVADEDARNRDPEVVPPLALALAAELPGKVSLDFALGPETFLATSLSQPRGWRALAVTGLLPITPVNLAFTGVRVPQNTSRVTLTYRPPALLIGMALTALALAALAALAPPRPGL